MEEPRSAQGSTAKRAISSYMPPLKDQDSKTDHVAVSEFMDHSCVRLRQDMQVYEAIDVLINRRITGAAVVDDDDNLVGIFCEKDCLRTLLNGAYDGLPGALVCHYMTQAVHTVEPSTDLMAVVKIFLENVFRRLLVVENGRLVGQVTRRDLLRAIQRVVKDRKTGWVH